MSPTGDDASHEEAARREDLLATYSRNVEQATGDGERYIHFGHWDVAPARGCERAGFAAAQAWLDARLRSMARLQPGLSVLDAGCGFGGTLEAIDRDLDRMTLVGLNLDPRQLAIARASFTPRASNTVAWIEGDASELRGFEDASFDRVLAVECIVHFAGRRAFVKGASRVLRPGGRLAISDIVGTRELRALRGSDAIPFDVDRLAATSLAPWPDFWGDDIDYDDMAREAGLVLDTRQDATEATLPSYRAILSDEEIRPTTHPADEGMLLLEWLQTRGLVRMLYLSFGKPTT